MTNCSEDCAVPAGAMVSVRPTRRRVLAGGLVGALAASVTRVGRGDVLAAGRSPRMQGRGSGRVAFGTQGVPEDCPILPSSNIWNTAIDELPVHELSDEFIASIGADTSVHPDFGSGEYEGTSIGIPFVVVPSDQEMVEMEFDVADESDAGPYPVPPDALIEGGPDATGDRHVIVLQEGTCLLYELYDASPRPDGSWQAFGGAVFDLTSNDLRPVEWTSADAAGLPILPGLIRYDEIEAGEIRHALRFTASRTQSAYVWPARHQAGATDDTGVPPMGQRFRLRDDVSSDEFSTTNRIIVQALKTYGMFLADNGSDWFLSGTPDDRWDNDDLHELQERLKGSDFEAVDCSSLMVDPDSGEAM